MESSFANFPIFTGDANIFRVAGTTMTIAFLTCMLSVTCRIIFQILKVTGDSPFKAWVRRHRKKIYRCLEFFYKTCMYPLLFFSFATLKNWDARVLVDPLTTSFLNISQGFAIMFICLYTLVTIYTVFF